MKSVAFFICVLELLKKIIVLTKLYVVNSLLKERYFVKWLRVLDSIQVWICLDTKWDKHTSQHFR